MDYQDMLQNILDGNEKVALEFEETIIKNPSILPGYRGFLRDYLPKNCKREEISALKIFDNIYLLKFEYFTSTVNTLNPLDFTESLNFITTNYSLLDDEDEDEETKKEITKPKVYILYILNQVKG